MLEPKNSNDEVVGGGGGGIMILTEAQFRWAQFQYRKNVPLVQSRIERLYRLPKSSPTEHDDHTEGRTPSDCNRRRRRTALTQPTTTTTTPIAIK